MRAQMYNYSTWIEEIQPEVLKTTFRDKLIEAGFGVLNDVEYYFNPQGYTILYLLSESHLALHTFPEENTTYLELSSCVKKPFDNFIKLL